MVFGQPLFQRLSLVLGKLRDQTPFFGVLDDPFPAKNGLYWAIDLGAGGQSVLDHATSQVEGLFFAGQRGPAYQNLGIHGGKANLEKRQAVEGKEFFLKKDCLCDDSRQHSAPFFQPSNQAKEFHSERRLSQASPGDHPGPEYFDQRRVAKSEAVEVRK